MSSRSFYLSATVALAVWGAPGAQENTAPRGFNYECMGGLSGSLKDELSTCRAARIWNDDIEIRAGEATTRRRDFAESEWQLSGAVRVSMGTAQLTADDALFTFVANELVAFELTGSPAELTDLIEERNATVSGSSNRIAYDERDQTVLLTGDVGFVVDGDEIATSTLSYNLEDRSFGTGDVRVTLGQTEQQPELQPEQRDPP